MKKSVALSNLSIYYTWKNIKNAYKNNKFDVSAPTWNDNLNYQMDHIPIWDIQDYFQHITKMHETFADNPWTEIYIIKTENRITFKIKTAYCLELLTFETMKLFGSNENKIIKDKNGENVPHLKITKVILVHCNNVNSDYQQNWVLYAFVPNE